MGEIERQWVSAMYPGPGWKARVKKMSDVQVIAIFLKEHSKPQKDAPERESKESNGDDIPF